MAALAEAEREAEAAGQSLFEYALTSIAGTAGVTSLVLGAKRPSQVAEAIAALDR
jgi:aryl-alcohol dehydrogenase-like predicted oxidoreductase